jgi:hypothetical protein
MDLVPEGLKDILANSRDHDSSTKVAEILQKQADHPQTSRLDVAWFAPRFAPRSSPSIYPRKRDKAARSATATTAPSRKVIHLVQIAFMEQELHVSPNPPIPTDSYLFL